MYTHTHRSGSRGRCSLLVCSWALGSQLSPSSFNFGFPAPSTVRPQRPERGRHRCFSHGGRHPNTAGEYSHVHQPSPGARCSGRSLPAATSLPLLGLLHVGLAEPLLPAGRDTLAWPYLITERMLAVLESQTAVLLCSSLTPPSLERMTGRGPGSVSGFLHGVPALSTLTAAVTGSHHLPAARPSVLRGSPPPPSPPVLFLSSPSQKAGWCYPRAQAGRLRLKHGSHLPQAHSCPRARVLLALAAPSAPRPPGQEAPLGLPCCRH